MPTPSTDAFHDALLGEDQLGAVVRAHIHLEARLNLVVEALIPFPEELPNLRYEQRVRLAVSLGLDKRFLPALLEIGRIRNAFAHRLDAALTDGMVDALLAALHQHDRTGMIAAYESMAKRRPDDEYPSFEALDAWNKFIAIAVAIDKYLLTAEELARSDQSFGTAWGQAQDDE